MNIEGRSKMNKQQLQRAVDAQVDGPLSASPRREPETLDHVASGSPTASRSPTSSTALGMHVDRRTDAFTLVGSDARRGKLTLFDAEGPRERGALKHVALRVSTSSSARLPTARGRRRGRRGVLRRRRGLRLGLVEAPTGRRLRPRPRRALSAEPEETARSTGARLLRAAPAVRARASRSAGPSSSSTGRAGRPEKPLLNHLACSSTRPTSTSEAESWLEIDDVVDAANTYAVFVWGPERVRSSTSSTSRLLAD
jgi:hypothetical protein